MRHMICLFAIVALAACDAPTKPPATQQEKDTAIRAWQDCLVAAARQYDDGYSDAGSIAAGIAPLCRPQYIAAIETMTRGSNPQLTRMVQQRMDAGEVQRAVPAVLLVRRSVNKAS